MPRPGLSNLQERGEGRGVLNTLASHWIVLQKFIWCTFLFNSRKAKSLPCKREFPLRSISDFWIFLRIKQMSSCIFLLLCSTDGVHMQIGDFLINIVTLGNICKYCNNALVRSDVVTHWDHTHKSKTPCLDTPGKMAWHGLEQALREGSISNMMGK